MAKLTAEVVREIVKEIIKETSQADILSLRKEMNENFAEANYRTVSGI
ncbi:MAG: hypothetical protein NVSMB39_4750 [Candidatus Saccharimonadales bacterium]